MSQMIYQQIPHIMADIGFVGKDKRNDAQKYRFRGIDDMYNTIQPALIKHGVFCCPQLLESSMERIDSVSKDGTPRVSFHSVIKMSHKFYAADGSFIDVVTVGEGLDQSDKASNKAMSAAMKYAFIELFSIPTEDVADSDRESTTVTGEAPDSFTNFKSGFVAPPQDMPPLPTAKPVVGMQPKPAAKKFL